MFSAAPGVEVEFRGMVGTIRFVDPLYITVCVKTQRDGMISDVCMLVYPHQWDDIKLIRGNRDGRVQ